MKNATIEFWFGPDSDRGTRSLNRVDSDSERFKSDKLDIEPDVTGNLFYVIHCADSTGNKVSTEEREINITELHVDTDNDGVIDYKDHDDDGDGIPDEWEERYEFDPLDPSDATTNPDSDGLSNLKEFKRGTNPLDDDTDGDGVNDEKDAYPTDPTRTVAEKKTAEDNKLMTIFGYEISIYNVLEGVGLLIPVIIGYFLLTRKKRRSHRLIDKISNCNDLDELEKIYEEEVKVAIHEELINPSQAMVVKSDYKQKHKELEKGEKKKEAAFDSYRSYLKKVYKDDTLSKEEGVMLSLLRKEQGISEEDHDRLLGEVMKEREKDGGTDIDTIVEEGVEEESTEYLDDEGPKTGLEERQEEGQEVETEHEATDGKMEREVEDDVVKVTDEVEMEEDDGENESTEDLGGEGPKTGLEEGSEAEAESESDAVDGEMEREAGGDVMDIVHEDEMERDMPEEEIEEIDEEEGNNFYVQGGEEPEDQSGHR